MTAVVPDAFLAAVGLGAITVISPARGGGTSNVTYIPVVSSFTSFQSTPSSSINVGIKPRGIVTGDFNADGKIDLAVGNFGSNTVSILLGNGEGTFTVQTPIAVGLGPEWLVTGDYNEDGKTDLTVANSIDNTVSILLGNGDGTFTLHSSPGTGASPFAVAAGDLNADGHLDLAVTDSADNTVTILLGNGDGTFVSASPLAVGAFPQVLVLGDFNEDGKLDIAVANESDSSVSMLLGNGDGTFQTQTTTFTGGSGFPIGLIAADFNNDTHLDVAAANGTDVAVLLGDGGGILTLNSNPAAGSFLISGVTGDSITFSPASFGAKVDTLSVDVGFVNTPPLTLALSGTGTVTSQTISKTFGAASIPLGGSTSLSFAIANPSSSLSLTGLAFTDSLPAGLLVATPPNVATTCTGTITAAAGASSVSLAGGTLAVTSSCVITVCAITLDVTGATAGVKNNSVTSTSNEAGTGNTANAAVTVVAPPVLAKAFGAASVPLNGSTSLSFTINNTNSATALSGITFSDTLPAGLVISTPNGILGSCGGGTITATQASNVVNLSGATIASSSSCAFAINVTGIIAGTQSNVTGNITSTEAAPAEQHRLA